MNDALKNLEKVCKEHLAYNNPVSLYPTTVLNLIKEIEILKAQNESLMNQLMAIHSTSKVPMADFKGII